MRGPPVPTQCACFGGEPSCLYKQRTRADCRSPHNETRAAREARYLGAVPRPAALFRDASGRFSRFMSLRLFDTDRLQSPTEREATTDSLRAPRAGGGGYEPKPFRRTGLTLAEMSEPESTCVSAIVSVEKIKDG